MASPLGKRWSHGESPVALLPLRQRVATQPPNAPGRVIDGQLSRTVAARLSVRPSNRVVPTSRATKFHRQYRGNRSLRMAELAQASSSRPSSTRDSEEESDRWDFV